jgi:hypothetical protein
MLNCGVKQLRIFVRHGGIVNQWGGTARKYCSQGVASSKYAGQKPRFMLGDWPGIA